MGLDLQTPIDAGTLLLEWQPALELYLDRTAQQLDRLALRGIVSATTDDSGHRLYRYAPKGAELATVIDDTYNANPAGAARALEALARHGAPGKLRVVVTPGQVVAVQSADPSACPVPYLGTHIYGKLIVDSVSASPTRVYFRTTVDPNCDFRSLLPGVPKD